MKILSVQTFLAFLLASIVYAHELSGQGILDTEISVELEGTSLKKALLKIERIAGVKFTYSPSVIEENQKVSIHASNKKLAELLDELFIPLDISYKVIADRISLYKASNPRSSSVNRTRDMEELILAVKGTVMDENGESLPGVNVIEKGTTNGTATDADGKFSMNVQDANSVLVFSFIGYVSQEVAVNGRSVIDVVLTADVQRLEEVVVVGYGTQKQELVTSSIAKVKKEEFNQGAITNSPLQLVQGKVAGLAIHQVNNDPAGGISFQLRGISTVSGSSSPLVIIDGVPSNISYVTPEDIESIDVLRDGSAAAIYGSRGTNGVIIITTKKGQEGKLQVEYSGFASYESLSAKPDLLTADEYRQVAKEYQESNNQEKVARGNSMIDYGSNTDWFKEITQNSLSQVHYFSVSGGNKNTTYMGSLNYRNNRGIIKRSGSDFLNGHIRLSNSSLNDRLKVSFDLSSISRKYNPTDYSISSQVLKRNPTQPVYNDDGTFYETYAWDDYNPVATIMQVDRDNEVTTFRGNSRISYEILPGLTASVMGGLFKEGNLYGYYQQKDAAGSVTGGYKGRATRSYDQYVEQILETTVNFSKSINDLHNIEILGGYTYENFRNEGFSAVNSSFITDQYTYNNLGSGDFLPQGKAGMSSYKSSSQLISFLARAMYSYNSKYLLTTGFRHEGSSKFGANEKWGMFPNLSLGWRISEESFMDNLTWVDDMKIRAGLGITGNQSTGPYASLVRLGPGGRMLYNGQWIQGMQPVSNPNPDLKWETKTEYNFGVDVTMFNNRLSSHLDFYNRKTGDLIYSYNVPSPPNIYNFTTANVGDMSNKGVEFAVNAIASQKNEFQWSIDFNISYNSNKLLRLKNENYTFTQNYRDILVINSLGLSNIATFRLQEGQPLGSMVGYRFAGFTDAGKWKVYNKEGEIIALKDAKQDDKDIIGNGLPKVYSGLTNTFRYRNFDLSVMLRGTFGFDIMSLEALTHQNPSILPLNVIRSSVEGELFDTPSYNSYYVEKGDFVKVDNVTFGYNFNVSSSKVFRRVRVYAAARNLYTVTRYSGSDPELEINGLGPGFDNRTGYPRTRTFTSGISLLF